MKKTLTSLLLVLTLLLGLTAPALAEEAEAATPAAPQRIVVLPIWAAEMLIPMVGTDRIVGVSAYMDDETVTYLAAEAAAIQGRVASNNAEGIIALSPDLVVLDSFSDWDGSLTKTLEDAGLPVIELESPTDFDTVMNRMTELGEATGEPAMAETMVQEQSARLNALGEKVKGILDQDRATVMYYMEAYDASGSSAGALSAYGAGSPFDAIAQAAGLTNVAAGAELYSTVSKEIVVADWKPEILIVPSTLYDANYVGVNDGGQTVIAAILADPTLATLPAVEKGRVYSIDDRAMSNTSQYMVQAAEELAKLAYPDLFE